MVKMEKIVKRRLSINIKVENVDEDQKKRIVRSPAKKLPEVNCKNKIVKLKFAPIPGVGASARMEQGAVQARLWQPGCLLLQVFPLLLLFSCTNQFLIQTSHFDLLAIPC